MKLILAFLLVISGSAISQQVPAFPEGAEKLNTKLLSAINTRHTGWVKAEAAKMRDKQSSPAEATSVAANYGQLNKMQGTDIDALAFLVLMQAAKSAQEDVKAVMASVKAVNATKEKMRETKEAREKLAANEDVAKLEAGESSAALGAADIGEDGGNTRGTKKTTKKTIDSLYRTIGFKSRITQFTVRTRKDLDTQIKQIQNDIDNLEQMSETQTLRLQMAMDRLSKMMSTLSNLQKKISGSAEAIANNLK